MSLRYCLLSVAVVACAGCASRIPLAEVQLVSKSFENLQSASQPLLDDLALAEREQGKRVADKLAHERAEDGPRDNDPCPAVVMTGGEAEGIPTVQRGFCARDSYYYSEIGDPPATRAFRRALAAVGDYTELLLILAEGRNLAVAQAQLQSVAGNLGSAIEAAGVAGAGAIAQSTLGALQPLIDLAAKDANAEELRRVVREEAPKVRALLAALRDAAPAVFNTLSEEAFRRFDAAEDNAELAQVQRQRIEGYRVAVSNYVVLLDDYESLLADLIAAYERGRRATTLASLAERSADLSARADAWRRTLAALRTGLR
jgi:hypothetical protein